VSTSEAPRFGNGRTEAEEKADDSRMIREGMQAAFPPLTYLDSQIGPAFPPVPERNRDYQLTPDGRQLTRCTATGWLAADDPSGDLCPCGRRHVTIRSWVDSGEGGQK
jgi:hypothetical protein